MVKHSSWRKGRRVLKMQNRAIRAIIRADRDRAELFNASMAAAKRLYSGYSWFVSHRMPRGSTWPDLNGMFVEVVEHPEAGDHAPSPGVYVVTGAHYTGRAVYDKLLKVRKLGVDFSSDDLMWFPRHGQRVLTIEEVGRAEI